MARQSHQHIRPGRNGQAKQPRKREGRPGSAILMTRGRREYGVEVGEEIIILLLINYFFNEEILRKTEITLQCHARCGLAE